MWNFPFSIPSNFLFDKMDVIIPFKIKIIQKQHTELLLDLWFLSCNKKFKYSTLSPGAGLKKIFFYYLALLCLINYLFLFITDVFLSLFHDGGRYHIETTQLICIGNQWTGFYMITASAMKELIELKNI